VETAEAVTDLFVPPFSRSHGKGANSPTTMKWNTDRFFVNLSVIRIRFIMMKLYLSKAFFSHMNTMRIPRNFSLLSFGREQVKKHPGGDARPEERG